MKTIICGGRDYQLTIRDMALLNRLRAELPITEVVCGEATGADAGGKFWAITNGIPVRSFPAQWRTRGKIAGPLRNQEMAEHAEACIAFPGGAGTSDMIRRARAKNLRVIVTRETFSQNPPSRT